jgi:hypothetical protein
MAILALVAGVLSFIPGLNLGVLMPIIAIILGVIAQKGETMPDWEGKGMAKSGVVCGIISLVLWVICICCIILYYFIVIVLGVGMGIFGSILGTLGY